MLPPQVWHATRPPETSRAHVSRSWWVRIRSVSELFLCLSLSLETREALGGVLIPSSSTEGKRDSFLRTRDGEENPAAWSKASAGRFWKGMIAGATSLSERLLWPSLGLEAGKALEPDRSLRVQEKARETPFWLAGFPQPRAPSGGCLERHARTASLGQNYWYRVRSLSLGTGNGIPEKHRSTATCAPNVFIKTRPWGDRCSGVSPQGRALSTLSFFGRG